jgi:hypothetical protein
VATSDHGLSHAFEASGTDADGLTGIKNALVKSSFSVHSEFFKRFIAQKIQRDTQGYKIVPLTNLP